MASSGAQRQRRRARDPPGRSATLRRLPQFTSLSTFLERPWAFFGMAAFTVLMAAIDSTIVAVVLPTLVSDLDTTLVVAAWTITAYALAQTVMLPMAGKLAEQFGQMRVFTLSQTRPNDA